MTCKEASRLASLSLDKPLPLGTRIRMRLHLLICAWCRRYVKQVRFIHEAAPKYEEAVDCASPKALSGEAKERMKKAIKSQSDGKG